ncbi:MAG: DUF2071 domain-containing protein [Flavobacteriales bacterium]|nr:DUF2071 domain-containing protein [Flavobacteriales bacterium]
MAKPFLTAEWKKLALLNYDVPPALLEEYVPFGAELDLWQGKCYVSLVGFMFLNTKVKGCKLPGHVNFEEVNLRFYVRHQAANGEWKRGVVFIQEIVPKPIITLVANKVYKEHYQTRVMDHRWEIQGQDLEVTYTWYIGNRENTIAVLAGNSKQHFAPGSDADFITEHYWGYTKISPEKTSEYEVKHPAWEVYSVKKAAINVDFGMTYGEEFEFLNDRQPVSVMLAEGSEISVGSKRIIRK